jgi:hypothetical protein
MNPANEPGTAVDFGLSCLLAIGLHLGKRLLPTAHLEPIVREANLAAYVAGVFQGSCHCFLIFYAAFTPELPLSESLSSYVEVVINAVKSAEGPVVLVGHSMAGAVASLVAEAVPDLIEQLVFLAAFAPQNSESINDKARMSLASALRDNMDVNSEGLVTVKEDVIASAFYHDCERPTSTPQSQDCDCRIQQRLGNGSSYRQKTTDVYQNTISNASKTR